MIALNVVGFILLRGPITTYGWDIISLYVSISLDCIPWKSYALHNFILGNGSLLDFLNLNIKSKSSTNSKWFIVNVSNTLVSLSQKIISLFIDSRISFIDSALVSSTLKIFPINSATIYSILILLSTNTGNVFPFISILKSSLIALIIVKNPPLLFNLHWILLENWWCIICN